VADRHDALAGDAGRDRGRSRPGGTSPGWPGGRGGHGHDDGLGLRHARPGSLPTAQRTAIDFLRDEVADICGALALGGSLLRRLGLGPEAARLEALFSAVEARLAEAQLSPESDPSCS